MTPDPPLVEILDVERNYQGLRPLRIARLRANATDRLTITGLDRDATEAFVHLVTGASVPDTGDVRIAGRSTRDISTDTEWLASLDRFGIVTARAILLEGLPIAANLALPMTLSIEVLAPDVRARVEALAADVGLAADRLEAAAATLTPEERVRVHLARAIALDPLMLILEHPTAPLDPAAADRVGVTLREVADRRALGWLALTADEAFARAAGGTRLRLKAATGDLQAETLWRRLTGRA